jgi:hypothetical protein
LSGKRRIEGLLPEEIHLEVYAENVDLVQALQSDKPAEKKSANSHIKSKLLEKFKVWVDAGKDCAEFEKLIATISKSFD